MLLDLFLMRNGDTKSRAVRKERFGREWMKKLFLIIHICLYARPQLHTVYGKARIVEAFYQYFMFGAIKGEIQSSHFEKIKKASMFAKKIVNESIENNQKTSWIEKNVTQIIKILEIDSLLTIPISVAFMKAGMALSEEELRKVLKIIAKNKEGDFGSIDPSSIVKGEDVYDEYKVLIDENKKNENKGISSETVGIQIPSTKNIDEYMEAWNEFDQWIKNEI